MNAGLDTDNPTPPGILTALLAHGWTKLFGITGFMLVFFYGYFYLLKRPAYAVRIVPNTWLDSIVSFEPAALFIYLSLWVYVSLPPALMLTRKDIFDYGARIGALCCAGFVVFYFWPSAIAPADIDWEKYPSVTFLKTVDTAGNALPSLHVATAVFSALWLHWRFKRLALAAPVRFVNALWCVAIAYSTLAIKQHVALDVFAGTALGVAAAWATGLKAHASRQVFKINAS